MPTICQQCNLTFCDCPPPAEAKPPTPKRAISNVRTCEINQLIREMKEGEISHADAMALYKELRAKISGDLALMQILAAELFPPVEVKSFDDFPL